MRARLPLRRKRNCTPLSGKRLLALWNTLPGVEKRRKVGDCEALIDELWSAVEALPEPEPLFWKRDTKFESDSLQRGVCKLSVPSRVRAAEPTDDRPEPPPLIARPQIGHTVAVGFERG